MVYKSKTGKEAPRTTNILQMIPDALENKDDVISRWKARQALDEVYEKSVRRGIKLTQEDLKKMESNYKRSSQYAMDIGTLGHSYIEAYLAREFSLKDGSDVKKVQEQVLYDHGDDAVDIAKKAFKHGFIKFYKDHNIRFTSLELRMVCENPLYGGTADATADVNIMGDIKRIGLDWKFANQLSKSYHLQAAAYWNALRERCYDAEEFWIVRIDKKNFGMYDILKLGLNDGDYYYNETPSDGLPKLYDAFSSLVVGYHQLSSLNVFNAKY